MYRAAFLTPELLLIECSMKPSPETARHRAPPSPAVPQTRREPNQTALSVISKLASVLCGL